MPRFLMLLLLLGLHVYTIVDILRSPWETVRLIPKLLWVPVSILPLAGPLAWLLLGRPLVGDGPGGSGGGNGGFGGLGGPRPGRGPVAPDDDPEFLRRLDAQAWAARMEQLRRERDAGARPEGAEGSDGETDPERPPADQT